MDENGDSYKNSKSDNDISGSDDDPPAIERGEEKPEVEEVKKEEEEVKKGLLLLKRLDIADNLIVRYVRSFF